MQPQLAASDRLMLSCGRIDLDDLLSQSYIPINSCFRPPAVLPLDLPKKLLFYADLSAVYRGIQRECDANSKSVCGCLRATLPAPLNISQKSSEANLTGAVNLKFLIPIT